MIHIERIRCLITCNGRTELRHILFFRNINCRCIEVLPPSICVSICDVLHPHTCRLRGQSFGNFHFSCQILLAFCVGFIMQLICQFVQCPADQIFICRLVGSSIEAFVICPESNTGISSRFGNLKIAAFHRKSFVRICRRCRIMFINHCGMPAVVFYADRFFIFLNDYAGMGHVASAGQTCHITALKPSILCFSIFFIRPDSPILQPQIQISMIFFSNCVSTILIFVRICTKPIPIRICRG